MEYTRNIKFYDNFDKKQFAHFTTSNECDDFIKYI